MKITEAIKKFLMVSANKNNRDLVERWHPGMETQLNVDPAKGTSIAENKQVWTYEDRRDSFEYRHIRIPHDAKTKPWWPEYEMEFDLSLVAMGIGSTGWNWEHGVSCWVGFDFDSMIGHGGTGLDDEQLDKIKLKASNLPYVEVRRSTGGKGLHLYVLFDAIPTANHTEHAKLGQIVLEMMSCDVKFDFLKRADGKRIVDVCGGNLWLWHLKMSLANSGLSLIKAQTRTLAARDLPSDWKERIKHQPQEILPVAIGVGSKWFAKAMKYIAEKGQASQGGRNNTSFRLSGHLAALPDDAGNLPSESQIYEIMRAWNCGNTPPLCDDELRSTITGGVNRGQPREKKEDTLQRALNELSSDGTVQKSEPNRKKVIRINSEIHRMVDEAAAALANAENTYVYGQALVEITYDAEKPPQCLHDNGSPQFVAIPRPTLASRLSKCVQWEKHSAREKGWVAARPDRDVVGAVHVASNWPGVPVITGIVSCPVLRADGSILTTPGYDRETGLYLESGESYPPLMRPDEAIEILFDVVQDFPFESEAHRSAWLAFLVTMLVRPAFAGSAPFFLFDANSPRTGKGLITDATTMIVECRKACRYSWSKDNEETRKLITTVGMSGAAYLLFDNIKGTLGGPALEKMMTTGVWADRLLSLNRQVTFPIRFISAGTSNNAKLSPDMAGRTCHSYLRTNMEHPEERGDFRHTDLLSYIKQRRQQLVMAALSIPAAYIGAGRPDQKLKAWGGFEAWSDLVRGSIVWAGVADPGETRASLRDRADDDSAILLAILQAWPKEPVTAIQAIKMAAIHPALGEAIAELPEHHRSQELGNLLRGARSRVIGGKRLEGSDTKPVKWQVFDA